MVFAARLLKFGYPGKSIFSSSVNVKRYALLDTLCLWRKRTLSLHIHSRNIILQMCSCTLHLLHDQTRSKNVLYRLYMSSEYRENMTFAFREKMCKVVQMWKLHHICYPLLMVQMYTFATHFLCAKILYKCVLLHYICLHKQTVGKCGHYRRCTYSKHCALKQTWSKLRKCGLYAIFAAHLLPAKIHFFAQ